MNPALISVLVACTTTLMGPTPGEPDQPVSTPGDQPAPAPPTTASTDHDRVKQDQRKESITDTNGATYPPRSLSTGTGGRIQPEQVVFFAGMLSNIVLRRVHTRTGIKWGPLVGLAAIIVYGLHMVATGTIVRDGGPGWVNLPVIIGFWSTCHVTFLIPTSVVRLLRVRHQEKVLLCDWQRIHATNPETERMEVQVPAAQAS
jgi:hypothetical protein